MINIYFSDTEAVEACICRLNVMWCDDDECRCILAHRCIITCIMYSWLRFQSAPAVIVCWMPDRAWPFDFHLFGHTHRALKVQVNVKVKLRYNGLLGTGLKGPLYGIRSELQTLYPRSFVPKNERSLWRAFVPGTFCSRTGERKFQGIFIPGPFCSQELSFLGLFVPGTLVSILACAVL